jgi:hypothetical protein
MIRPQVFRDDFSLPEYILLNRIIRNRQILIAFGEYYHQVRLDLDDIEQTTLKQTRRTLSLLFYIRQNYANKSCIS